MMHNIIQTLTSPKALQYMHYVRYLSWFGVVGASIWALGGIDEDVHHGDLVRILFIHVPAAWGALACYTVMAVTSGFALIYRSFPVIKIAHAFAWPGFFYAMISIVTGMIWGKPAWGTWWVWDARLTSMLILAFLYIAFLHFASSRKTLTTAGLVAIVGWINIPLIKGSVNWWATLHQKPSVSLLGGSSLDIHYMWPLAMMTLSWICFTFSWAGRWYVKQFSHRLGSSSYGSHSAVP